MAIQATFVQVQVDTDGDIVIRMLDEDDELIAWACISPETSSGLGGELTNAALLSRTVTDVGGNA